MSFFSSLSKPGANTIKPASTTIRKETRPAVNTSVRTVTASNPGKPVPSPSSAKADRLKPKDANGSMSRKPRSPSKPVKSPSTSATTLKPPVDKTRASDIRESRKRKSQSPAISTPHFGSDSDEEEEDAEVQRKRVRSGTPPLLDENRTVRDSRPWYGDDETVPLITGKDFILNYAQTPEKYEPVFTVDDPSALAVQLQYPGAGPMEPFRLVQTSERDGFQPLEDIAESVVEILSHYLPADVTETHLSETDGTKIRLRRAVRSQDLEQYKSILASFNELVQTAMGNGMVKRHLDAMHTLPLPLVERILSQIYARTVSPKVETLRHYENGTSTVYGELMPKFVSQILRDVKLDSTKCFLDLGSGVGNVVLQAALEIGCESYGMELMENPCALAAKQLEEFVPRARLWGISTGKADLWQGDFCTDERVTKLLQRADVVLVNNQAFQPDLNDVLTYRLLDLKEGAKVISLKSFVPEGWKYSERTAGSVLGLLQVEKKQYRSGYVSWKDEGGDYFVATKKSQVGGESSSRDRARNGSSRRHAR